MGIERFFVEPVQIFNPTTREDRYGATVRNYDVEPIETLVWASPKGSKEDHANSRDGVITSWVLDVQPDVTVTAWSQVDLRGHRYKVIGRPSPAPTPDGDHHIEVDIELVEG